MEHFRKFNFSFAVSLLVFKLFILSFAGNESLKNGIHKVRTEIDVKNIFIGVIGWPILHRIIDRFCNLDRCRLPCSVIKGYGSGDGTNETDSCPLVMGGSSELRSWVLMRDF